MGSIKYINLIVLFQSINSGFYYYIYVGNERKYIIADNKNRNINNVSKNNIK